MFALKFKNQTNQIIILVKNILIAECLNYYFNYSTINLFKILFL